MQSQSVQQSLTDFVSQTSLLDDLQFFLAEAWQPLMPTVSTHMPDKHTEQLSSQSSVVCVNRFNVGYFTALFGYQIILL